MTTTTLHPEFDVTERTHTNCTYCAEAANRAATMANVTGSTGASYKVTSPSGNDHSATVARVRCLSGRSDCCCPLHAKLARFQPADPFDGINA